MSTGLRGRGQTKRIWHAIGSTQDHMIEPWLLFLHVLGAIAWVGGGLTTSLIAVRIMSRGDPAAVTDFGQTLSFVGPRLFAPSVAIVLITGVWMVLTMGAWDFSQLWVLIGIACFVVAAVIGAIFLGRLGVALGKPTEPAGEASALLRRWVTIYAAVVVVLLIAVWDMTVKPGL